MNSPLRILHLEDDPKDAALVQAMLEADGFAGHITRVESQIDFCASLEQGGFDLILADYTLPSFDGISALKIAVEKRPEVPFIFVSGTLDEEIAIEALKIGATDYVFKTRLSRIIPALQRALRDGQDRAERNRTEEALLRSEAYLAEAQRISHTGSFGWNVSTGELFWSDETFRIFQYDRTTTPTVELVLRRIHPEDAALVSRTIERASRDRADFDFGHRLLLPDGSVKHVQVVAHALSNESGDIEFVGAVMDVTERRRAEALLDGEKRLLEMVARGDSLAHILNSLCLLVEEQASDVLASILLLDSNGRQLRHGAAPSLPKAYTAAIDGSVIGPSVGSCGTAAHLGKQVIVSDIASDPLWADFRELALVHSLRACWSTPILSAEGKVIGTFAMHYREPRSPGSRDQEIIAQITHLAGVAVQRKLAEDALRQSQAYLAEAERLSHTGSWASRPARGENTYWSEECYRLMGFDPNGGLPGYETVLQRFHPDDQAKVREAVETAEREKADFELDYRIVHSGGEIRNIHVAGHPVLSPSGDFVEFVGTVVDITERKRAEESLRRSEGYLAEAQRLSHTGSWASIPATGEIRYFSEECYRVTGFDPHDGQPRYETFLERVHPEDRAKLSEAVEKAGRENTEFELDYRIVHPGGEVRDIHVLGHPVRSAAGDSVEFVGTVIDITERKRAEESLRRSEGYLAEAQRLSHTGSWAWAPATGEIKYCSDECYRVLGFDPKRGQPRFETFFNRIHPDDQPRVAKTLERASRERAEFELDDRIVYPGGEIRDVHVVGHPVLGPSGDLVEFVGTLMDVTERKRAEEESERLRQAQAELAHINRVNTMGELTASLAHEVNQPIAAAVTNADTCLRWLAADVPNLDKARAAAMRIVKDGTRAAEIISRIRLLFQKGTPQRQLADVNEVIREMIVLLHGEVTQYSISVRTGLATDLPQVMVDRVQLQQVMMNLMTNSVDAMKAVDGSRDLVIQSRRGENGHLLLSVSDTGVGLPPQHADRIFNAFFTTKPHGTGMGLRICRSIVESHGGRLWAADNPPRGATFYVSLPSELGAQE